MARRVVVKRTVEVLTEPKFSVMFATKEAWPIVAPTLLWPGDASAVTKVFNNTSQRVHSFLRGCPGVWEQKLASRSVTIMEMPEYTQLYKNFNETSIEVLWHFYGYFIHLVRISIKF